MHTPAKLQQPHRHDSTITSTANPTTLQNKFRTKKIAYRQIIQNFQTLSINFHLPHIFNGDFNSHNKPIMLQQLRRKKKKNTYFDKTKTVTLT